LQGAVLTISIPITLQKNTGSFGEALLWFPPGTNFSGIAQYGNLSKAFTSAEVDSSGSRRTLTVKLPEKPEAAPVVAGVASSLQLTLRLANGSAGAGRHIGVDFGSSHYDITTGSNGIAALSLNGTGPASVSILEDEYAYNYVFSVNGPTAQEIDLAPLLHVNSFVSIPDGEGCYRVVANITDPRTSLPLDVKIQRFEAETSVSLPVSGEAGGLFSSRLCIKAQTMVTVSVSNKYEAAGAVLTIVPGSSGPVGPVAIPGITEPAPAPKPQGKPIAPETLFLPALLLGILAGLVLAAIFARRYIYQIPRFIAEYLHKTLRDMQRKRPPMQPPLGDEKPPAE